MREPSLIRINSQDSRLPGGEVYRRLADNSLGLLCCHDLNGVLIWINFAAAESLGYAPEDGIGRKMEEFLAPEVRPLFSDYLQRIRVNHYDNGLLRLVARDGTQRIWMYRNVLDQSDPDGNRVLGLALDVTERVRMEKSLQQSEERYRQLNAELEERVAARTRELEQSNAELQHFAHIVSHDLQAPLRQVRALLDYARRESVAEPRTPPLTIIERSTEILERMSTLIDSLLNYSTSSNGGRQPVRPVDSGAILNQTLIDLQSSIGEAGAQVTHANMPAVMMDPADLLRVFQNLLTNALKYRRAAPPMIHVDAYSTEDEWVLSVKDNGIGIDPEHSQKIFLPFRRLHGAEYPGTGIGLAVCKKIVERNHGRLWVESQPNQGATFFFTVPR